MRGLDLVLALSACAQLRTDPVRPPTGGETSAPDVETIPDAPALPWGAEVCAGLPTRDLFADDRARWTAQDDAAPPDPGQIVVVGSSSIRRWEHAFRDLAPYGVVQRGFGGSQLTDVVAHLDALVGRHQPAGILLFAGANDLAFGASADDTAAAWQCLVHRVFEARGPMPVVTIAVTPTPARWAGWDEAAAFNAAITALAADHPDLHVVDVATPFLATGTPPAPQLFVDDRLHLSGQGYALWSETILAVASQAFDARPAPTTDGPAAGTYVRVDLGPSTPQDGRPAPSPDPFGNHWNAWHAADVDAQVLAGEALRELVTTTGVVTGVDLVITGGFRTRGVADGGFATPDGEKLETLAVPDATGDVFTTEGPDDPAGFAFTGLTPGASHTLRVFASRDDPERRVTRVTVAQAGAPVEGLLQTSGPGAGAAQANDGTVLTLSGLRADTWGQLFVDVSRAEGRAAYVSLVELEVE